MKVQVYCLREGPEDIPADVPVLVRDAPDVDAWGDNCQGILLPDGSETRAGELLDAGAPRVFVGEAALRDSGVIERLATRHGGARVGLYVPVRRMPVAWALDVQSNADFKVLAPSRGQAAWEVLYADGRGSGAEAAWWIGEMGQRGAQTVLLRADVTDADFNLCASLVEDWGERIWVASLQDPAPALADWIAYGQVRRIAVPPSLYAQRGDWMPIEDVSEMTGTTGERV